MKSIVDQSHDFLKDVLHKGAICIDATLGWGKDTDFFLKNNVRKVYGFEIQQVVFEQTVSNIRQPFCSCFRWASKHGCLCKRRSGCDYL